MRGGLVRRDAGGGGGGGSSPVSAPPPPPPPLSSSPTGGRRKLRTFHWEALPAERVRGRRGSLWSAAGGFGLDRRLLDELFAQRPEAAGGGLRRPHAQQKDADKLEDIQRKATEDATVAGKSVAASRIARYSEASVLDSKKILNLGIFLKQFKRPVQAVVADIRDGDGALYGPEKLLELAKMLPDGEEVRKLEAFRGSQSQLSEAEVFALLLVQVPSWARRLELLVLKEEFFPRLSALRSAIQVMTEAATELLECAELHDLIRLVLETGNYMNEGGYAGSALGFRVSSLLRLADTKANKPGMDLLHFVALEAERKAPRLLFFPRKLPHVGPASRILVQEVVSELQRLGQRVQDAWEGLEAADLKAQMEPFLRVAEAELSLVKTSVDHLKQATATLCDFFCEEPETFSLAECCRIFHTFGQRFLVAAQENQAREAAERRQHQHQEKKKRRSIATCSARDPELLAVELDLLFLGSPRSGHSLQGPQPFSDSPQCRERPLPLRRRHTLTLPAPCPEPSPQEPPTPAGPKPVPSCEAKGPRLFGQALQAILASPPAGPSKEPHLPEAAPRFRLPTLFQKKLLVGGTGTPAASQASPKEASGLVRFFRRLSLGDKSQQPPQA